MATACSEGAKPGRTVRILDPNEHETACGAVADKI
jgi:hypothetical protein